MIGVRYQKDGQAQPFVISHYSDHDAPTGNIELKEAVKPDFQEAYTVNILKQMILCRFGIKKLAVTQ